MEDTVFEAVVQALQHHGVTLSDFCLDLLASQAYNRHPIVIDLLSRSADLFTALVNHPSLARDHQLDKRAHGFITQGYLAEIKHVAAEESGWHFGVHHSTLKQFEEFSLEDMGRELEQEAPKLWHLLGELLGGPGCRDIMEDEGAKDHSREIDSETIMGDDTYWNEVEEIDLEGFINGLTADGGPQLTATNKRKMRRVATLLIVSSPPTPE